MNDPKDIAAGILARGRSSYEASGAKSVICSCARLGMYRCEAHGEANRRKEGEAFIAAMGVTELLAHHAGARGYVAQLESDRDSALARLSAAELELACYKAMSETQRVVEQELEARNAKRD